MTRSAWSASPAPIRLLVAFALALIGLALAASSAAAAPPTHIRDRALFADAVSSECVVVDVTEVCTSVEVFVTNGASPTVCFFSQVLTFSLEGDLILLEEEFGCAEVSDDDFSIDRQLTAAQLDPVTIVVERFVCDEFECTFEGTREVTVSASWTATGDLVRESFRSKFSEGKCRVMSAFKGEFRDADATIVVDGQVFDAEFATLGRTRESIKISSECDFGV